jgi:transposase
MSEKKTRKQYSKEFKLDVIQQSYLRENIRELANELGLRPELIYKWRTMYEDRQSAVSQFPGNGVAGGTPEEQRLRKLEAENAELRMERDILKKAIGIFGKTNG